MIKRRKSRESRALIVALAGSLLIGAVANADAPPDHRFKTATDALGGVIDNVTGLTWQQADTVNKGAWNTVTGACPQGWRAPTVDELYTLIDVQAPDTVYDPIFTVSPPTPPGGDYWSGTTVLAGGSGAFYVSFYRGNVDHDQTSQSYYMRCVR